MANTFKKGSSTFTCDCCGHLTRYTGVQAISAQVCPICWDLAGYENSVQDENMTPSDEKYVTSIFVELRANRTEAQYAQALSNFELLADFFPGDDVAAPVAPVEAAPVVVGSVAICRAILAADPTITRKAFVAAAVEKGVLKTTAGTQFNRINKG